jgi:hypothetical protein
MNYFNVADIADTFFKIKLRKKSQKNLFSYFYIILSQQQKYPIQNFSSRNTPGN